MLEYEDDLRTMGTPEENTGGILDDIEVVNMTHGLISSALGCKASSVRGIEIPLFYDPTMETDLEAMEEWTIEFRPATELTGLEAEQFSGHWVNREKAIERLEEQLRLAASAAATAPIVMGPTPAVCLV